MAGLKNDNNHRSGCDIKFITQWTWMNDCTDQIRNTCV